MNYVWLCVCFLGILVAASAVSSKDCRVVGQHLSYCTETYGVEPMLVKGIPFFTNASDFQLFCSQADELLLCFHGIFGHCSVMFYDYNAYEATFHDICRNITFAIDAFDGCIDQTNDLIEACMVQYRIETIELYRALAGKFLNPEVQCGLYSNLRKCLVWNTTRYCSTGYSSFLTSIFQRRFTPTLCKDIYTLEDRKKKKTDRNASHKLNFSGALFILIFILQLTTVVLMEGKRKVWFNIDL